jgi:adenine-specific DNA-methyltransferase
MAAKPKPPSVTVATLTHDEATRRNIPTAEYQSVMQKDEQDPIPVTYTRGAAGLDEEKEERNRDLDPQLVWRGKDQQDWSDLIVQAPPLYIQEKVHPKVLIDDLLRQSTLPAPSAGEGEGEQLDLFADFNGIPKDADRTEFYRHDQNWSNRMILGDSLQVMASLAEREGLRGKVQCIYLDPPYGIKFNSNFQWSTTSRDVKDGNVGHITREPEQVKAFRDTWRDGIHSYLTYLRDRLTVARDLLTDSGSIFVQIGDENVHRVRAVMDEVFGDENFCGLICFATTSSQTSELLSVPHDFLVWFAKSKPHVKFRKTFLRKEPFEQGATIYSRIQLQNGERFAMSREDWISRWCKETDCKVFALGDLSSQRQGRAAGPGSAMYFPLVANGREFYPGGNRGWSTTKDGLDRIVKANRYQVLKNGIMYVRMHEDYPVIETTSYWMDTASSFSLDKVYVVQTNAAVVQRAFLISTDPGDLVLDPTCGSGTTAYVAEQWGRRWITIDTSRVALALARARIMGARYPYYLLADSRDGQMKEAEVSRTATSSQPTRGDIRHGFVYERVPHITLKAIANNTEIDVIWEKWQATLEPLRQRMNAALVGWVERSETHPPAAKSGDGFRSRSTHPTNLCAPFEEWEIPREVDVHWPQDAKTAHADWWQARIARQQEIDASIAAKADSEYLYDKPYTDNKKVRVAGPFTVESLSPHRVLGVDENDELVDPNEKQVADPGAGYGEKPTFPQMILENLKVAGVQQAHKEDRITFTSLTPWPGDLICAEGRYVVTQDGHPAEGQDPTALSPGHSTVTSENRAAIFIGPEFGTVTRPDLVTAAREAGDADFDCLIACAFNYEAHATEFSKLGRIPVLKARMNADLHMAEDLKTTSKGNLFVIFGEPDIAILPAEDGQVRIKINGVDVFHPSTGEVRSDGPEGIACWFIDTDYNEESFFVRHAYFLGAADPYKALKTTLKAEINEEAWATLNSDTSRPFPKPASGRIAVKVINHLGDEVMKVFRVPQALKGHLDTGEQAVR